MMQASALLLLSLLPLGPQDPPPQPADKRPEVAELLEKLKAHAGKDGEQDKDAIAVIDQLNQEFRSSGPKDRGAIVKGLSKCFEERRLEKDDAPPQNQLYLAAAAALSQLASCLVQ